MEERQMQSTEIGELAKALSQAQGQIKGAVKEAENPYYKSTYANLAAVWDACREPLSKNGLAVIQTTSNDNGNIITVITTLVHSSGQWISGRLSLQPVKVDPQSIGSAITYARRYALSAIVGVSPEDDDGESAMGRNNSKLPQHNNPPSIPEPQQKKRSVEQPNPSTEHAFAIAEAGKMLLDLSGGDKERAVKLLETFTSFVGKDGKQVQGRKTLAGISDKQLNIVCGRAKDLIAERKHQVDESASNIAPQNRHNLTKAQSELLDIPEDILSQARMELNLYEQKIEALSPENCEEVKRRAEIIFEKRTIEETKGMEKAGKIKN